MRRKHGAINFPPWMQHLANVHTLPDPSTLEQFANGHPVVGEVEQGGHMAEKLAQASASSSDVAASVAQRNERVQQRVPSLGEYCRAGPSSGRLCDKTQT